MSEQQQRIKRRKPTAKRQIDWFPAPPPPPPLPEHLVPDVPVVEEEEIIVPVVVEQIQEDPPISEYTFVPNLTLATRDPTWMPGIEQYDWSERIQRMDVPF